MTSFNFSTADDFKDTRFGGYLLELVGLLELPVPTIKGNILKKFNKEGCWGIKAIQAGRQTEPQTDAIEIKLISDSMEKGLNLIIQDLIARLCGRHHRELRGHYFHHFGRRSEAGEPYDIDVEDRCKFKPVCRYLQDLENHLNDLHEDRRSELLKNDELCAQLKESEKKIQAQEEEAKAQQELFKAQEKKFQNQEKRNQAKNKEIRTLKMELESNEVELEADHDLIERLRAEKRELQEKNSALEKELKELKMALDKEGITIEIVEEDEDAMVE